MHKKRRGIGFYLIIILATLSIACCAQPEAPPETTTNVDMLTEEGTYEVQTQDVSYFENANGFLAKPAETGPYPGVIMIHEWWDLNENIKDMAKQLASEGYVVLDVDLYDGQVAADSDAARELSSKARSEPEKAVENMKAAAAYLRDEQAVTKLASMGWCFGGGQSLQLALSDEDLDATVIYYGSLVTNETELAGIEWPVLGVFGDQDTSIPVDTVNAFDAALDNLGVENEIYVYPGVGHAFANPSGTNYAAEETKDAWEKTVAFLDVHLR